MKKLHLTIANPGYFTKDKQIYERVKGFNNALIQISASMITIRAKDIKTFTSDIRKTEEDKFTETFEGNFENGVPFRIVKPTGIIKEIMKSQGKSETVAFGGLSADSYSVHFNLVSEDEADTKNFTESKSTAFASSADSKAETLIGSANLIIENPTMAGEQLKRVVILLEENETEFLRFNYIENIVSGYMLAVKFGVLSMDNAEVKFSNLKLRYISSDHIRYENEEVVTKYTQNSQGHNYVKRCIEIIPNYDDKEGYLITIYKLNSANSYSANSIQMATKKMRTISKTQDEIKLQGFGVDTFGESFENYALTIGISINEIDCMTLHILDRRIDIKYLK